MSTAASVHKEALLRIRFFLMVVLIFTIVGLSYYNGLDNEYTFDDHLAIVNNNDTNPGDTDYQSLWKNDLWGKAIVAEDSHRSYRPLLILTFKLLRQWRDRPDTLRGVSIIAHALSSLLLYFLSMRITHDQFEVSMGAAVLFAAHSVHTEAVTAVVNSGEPIHCVFFLLALIVYIATTTTTTTTRMKAVATTAVSSVFFVLAFAVSVLFKESAVTLLGIVMAHCVLSLLQPVLQETTRRQGLAVSVYWLLLSLSCLLAYVALRVHLLGRLALPFAAFASQEGTGTSSGAPRGVSELSGLYLDDSQLLRKAENPFGVMEDGFPKVYSFVYLHFRYLWLLVFPISLSAEYSFNCIPAVASAWDPRLWYGIASYLTVFVVGVYSLYSFFFTNKAQPPDEEEDEPESSPLTAPQPDTLAWALLLLLVPLLPATGIFFRLGTLLAERLLYVPSTGYCLLTSWLLWVCSCRTNQDSKAVRVLYGTIVTMLGLALAYGCVLRNPDWKSDATLFAAGLRECPNSAKMHLQVAKMFINNGEPKRGRFHVNRAKQIDPDFCDIALQEALLFFTESPNDINPALSALLKSIQCKFTATQALPMLNQLWKMQIDQAIQMKGAQQTKELDFTRARTNLNKEEALQMQGQLSHQLHYIVEHIQARQAAEHQMLFIAINKLYSARSQCEHAGAESLFDCWVLSLELQQLIGAWSVDPGEHGGDRMTASARSPPEERLKVLELLRVHHAKLGTFGLELQHKMEREIGYPNPGFSHRLLQEKFAETFSGTRLAPEPKHARSQLLRRQFGVSGLSRASDKELASQRFLHELALAKRNLTEAYWRAEEVLDLLHREATSQPPTEIIISRRSPHTRHIASHRALNESVRALERVRQLMSEYRVPSDLSAPLMNLIIEVNFQKLANTFIGSHDGLSKEKRKTATGIVTPDEVCAACISNLWSRRGSFSKPLAATGHASVYELVGELNKAEVAYLVGERSPGHMLVTHARDLAVFLTEAVFSRGFVMTLFIDRPVPVELTATHIYQAEKVLLIALHCWRTLGALHAVAQSWEKAVHYFERAISLRDRFDVTFRGRINIAAVLRPAGDRAQGDAAEVETRHDVDDCAMHYAQAQALSSLPAAPTEEGKRRIRLLLARLTTCEVTTEEGKGLPPALSLLQKMRAKARSILQLMESAGGTGSA